MAGKPGWPGEEVERAVHKVRRLWQETGKAVTGQVKEKVPDTLWLIGVVYQNHMFKYSTKYYLFA